MTGTPYVSQQGPPYSIHSERVAVASMVRFPSLIGRMREILPDPSVLYSATHERQYRALLQAHENSSPATTADLSAVLGTLGLIEAIGGTAALRELAAEGLEETAALDHARNLAEKARMRRLIETLAELLNQAYRSNEGFDALLKSARKRLDALARAR
jgi:replicative DNA helicase